MKRKILGIVLLSIPTILALVSLGTISGSAIASGILMVEPSYGQWIFGILIWMIGTGIILTYKSKE